MAGKAQDGSRRVIAVSERADATYAGQDSCGRRRKTGEVFDYPGHGPLPLARRSRKTGMIERGWVLRVDANNEPIEESFLEDAGPAEGVREAKSEAKPKGKPGRVNRTALSPAQRAMQVADPNEKRTAKLDPERVAR